MNVHEGSIRVSRRAGKGCTFTLIFPLAAQREAQTVSTIRIMLVEDDLDYRYLIEQALRRRRISSFARAAQTEKARCKPRSWNNRILY